MKPTVQYSALVLCIVLAYMHMYCMYAHRHAGIINLSMNAGKFVSDISHQHNTSLHSYLQPSSSPSSARFSSQRQGTTNTALSQNTLTNKTMLVRDNNEQTLLSTCNQVNDSMISTDKNSNLLVSNNGKVDASESRKNSKRKSTDIQNYFTSSGMTILIYVATCVC